MRFICVLLALMLSGCETTKLWWGKPGEEFVKILPTTPEEDVETALKESGREYYCRELYASSHPPNCWKWCRA